VVKFPDKLGSPVSFFDPFAGRGVAWESRQESTGGRGKGFRNAGESRFLFRFRRVPPCLPRSPPRLPLPASRRRRPYTGGLLPACCAVLLRGDRPSHPLSYDCHTLRRVCQSVVGRHVAASDGRAGVQSALLAPSPGVCQHGRPCRTEGGRDRPHWPASLGRDRPPLDRGGKAVVGIHERA
jgi:hypothetical protein